LDSRDVTTCDGEAHVVRGISLGENEEATDQTATAKMKSTNVTTSAHALSRINQLVRATGISTPFAPRSPSERRRYVCM